MFKVHTKLIHSFFFLNDPQKMFEKIMFKVRTSALFRLIKWKTFLKKLCLRYVVTTRTLLFFKWKKMFEKFCLEYILSTYTNSL